MTVILNGMLQQLETVVVQTTSKGIMIIWEKSNILELLSVSGTLSSFFYVEKIG